jgi:hypothetical protein
MTRRACCHIGATDRSDRSQHAVIGQRLGFSRSRVLAAADALMLSREEVVGLAGEGALRQRGVSRLESP